MHRETQRLQPAHRACRLRAVVRHRLQPRRDAAQAGQSSRNEPAELPRIAGTLAALRGWSLEETAEITRANACAALPGLAALIGAAT